MQAKVELHGWYVIIHYAEDFSMHLYAGFFAWSHSYICSVYSVYAYLLSLNMIVLNSMD